MYSIRVNFEEPAREKQELSGIDGGQTLLEVLLRHDIEIHHNCGGVCSCTTCHLYIDQGMEYIDIKEKREEDFIKRARHPQENSRLGCQSLLLEGGGEIIIRVPDQSQLPDEFYGVDY